MYIFHCYLNATLHINCIKSKRKQFKANIIILSYLVVSIEPNSFNFARFVERKAKVNTRKIDQTKAVVMIVTFFCILKNRVDQIRDIWMSCKIYVDVLFDIVIICICEFVFSLSNSNYMDINKMINSIKMWYSLILNDEQ